MRSPPPDTTVGLWVCSSRGHAASHGGEHQGARLTAGFHVGARGSELWGTASLYPDRHLSAPVSVLHAITLRFAFPVGPLTLPGQVWLPVAELPHL